jgi:hypothetical protein
MCLNPVARRTKHSSRIIRTHKNKEGKWIKKRVENEGHHPQKLVLAPCGYCAECETKKRRDWAFRMKWETLDHKYSWFVLLTYDEENCPWYDIETQEIVRGKDLKLNDIGYVERCVHKPDVQKFIKRLRERQQYYSDLGFCENTEIRYFAVAEYGEQSTNRPHYHLVIWGMSPFIKEHLIGNKIWKLGMVSARALKSDKPAGFMYLTKYLYKQKLLKNKYVPTFSLMSKKPYIGNRFEKYVLKYNLIDNTYRIPGLDKIEYIPLIYRNKMPEIKRIIAKNKMLAELDKKELDLIQQYLKKGKNYHLDLLSKRYDKNLQQFKDLIHLKSIQ